MQVWSTHIQVRPSLTNEYLDRIPATQKMINWLKLFYIIEYGRDAEEQSCLNLLYLIGTNLVNLVFWTSDEQVLLLDGGNDQVPVDCNSY